jgi:hypothetical protein
MQNGTYFNKFLDESAASYLIKTILSSIDSNTIQQVVEPDLGADDLPGLLTRIV